MQRKLRGSDIPAATEATLLHAAAFLEFKQHVARGCILAAAVLGRRQKWFLYTPLRQAEFLRDIGGLAHRIILRCVITQSSGKQRVIDNGDTGGQSDLSSDANMLTPCSRT